MVLSDEFLQIFPIIVSLVVIEGLLSIDNALAIAALASHLPSQQQRLALKLGIFGAYAFRGTALFFVTIIIANPWLKIVGGTYLVYLMASNLVSEAGNETEEERQTWQKPQGLFLTIVRIECLDLSLSLDNVVAAVAFDKRLWVVCTGVFIGILVLRFLAGVCIRLIARFPILESTAFLLIGFVGVILLVEVAFELANHHVQINAFWKFIGILSIITLSIAYSSTELGRRLVNPVLQAGLPVMRLIDGLMGVAFWPAATAIRLTNKLVVRRLIAALNR